jgi:ABC-2 type transport system ATP-binding protein
VLEVEDVHKSYGQLVALAGVDLHVASGEVVGLVGPNGAGKTSLVSIVAGLRRPDRGRVRVGDVDVVRHRDKVGPLLGLAPQELAIYPRLKVRDNLALFAELAGLRRAALRRRIDETAAALSLTDLLNRPAMALSGGQKRRVHTAMALIHRPPLLLLDEPTVGADIETRAELLQLVRRLADEGAAIVYSTHYLPEVEELDATVAVIDSGRVLARGALRELLGRHASPAVELVFDNAGPPPHLGDNALVDGPRVRIRCDEPAATAARLLADLGPDARRLTSVELVQPTLESVYLAVTGRRYDANLEVEDVAVA